MYNHFIITTSLPSTMPLTFEQEISFFRQKLVSLGVNHDVVDDLRSFHNITTFAQLKNYQRTIQLSILSGISGKMQQKLKLILAHMDMAPRSPDDYDGLLSDGLLSLPLYYRPISKEDLNLAIEAANHPSIEEELGYPPDENTEITRRHDLLGRTYRVTAETPLDMCGYCGIKEGELDCHKLVFCPCGKAAFCCYECAKGQWELHKFACTERRA